MLERFGLSRQPDAAPERPKRESIHFNNREDLDNDPFLINWFKSLKNGEIVSDDVGEGVSVVFDETPDQKEH